MASVETYTSTQVTPILQHNSRKRKHHSNTQIDPNRSHLNYSLTPDRDGLAPYDYYKQRLAEIYVYGRADVKVMAEWIVTAPRELADDLDKQHRFFVAVHDFLQQRYGPENEVSAQIHYDEGYTRQVCDVWGPIYKPDGSPLTQVVCGQPHIHYDFIPVVSRDPTSNHPQEEKVCAHDVITRKELKTFHSDLQTYLDEHLNFHAPVHTGITAANGRNRTVEELKREYELLQEIERLKERTHELERDHEERKPNW